MLALQVRVDDREVVRLMRQAPEQVRYAAARALTATAKVAQQRVIAELPQHFTIRTPWVAKGIRVKAARKADLLAIVHSRDDFMARQETGGERPSVMGKRNIAVPMVGAGRGRSSLKSVTRQSRWPKNLLKKPGFFIAPLSGGEEMAGVFRRLGRPRVPTCGRYLGATHTSGKQAGKKIRRQEIKLIFILQEKSHIEARFGFRNTVGACARARFPVEMRTAMAAAMATAR